MVVAAANRYCMRIPPPFAGEPRAMDRRLLDILCCPTTRVPLRLLDAGELDALNRAIDGGHVQNAAGSRIDRRLAAGLVTTDRRTIYPIEDDIPVLLADEAVSSSQVDGFARG
jgi:uncharacterized protein YbaR (Trm112 family)